MRFVRTPLVDPVRHGAGRLQLVGTRGRPELDHDGTGSGQLIRTCGPPLDELGPDDRSSDDRSSGDRGSDDHSVSRFNRAGDVPHKRSATDARPWPGGRGAGGTSYSFDHLTNVGSTTCSMIGYPGVAFLDARGAVVQHPAGRSPDHVPVRDGVL